MRPAVAGRVRLEILLEEANHPVRAAKADVAIVGIAGEEYNLRGRPSFAKRKREQQRAERKKEKAERRELRKDQKQAGASNVPPGEDPDIADIQPGPQKLDPELFGDLASGDVASGD